MCAGLEVLERRRPTGVELDRADGVGLAGVLRAVLALLPRSPNASDIVERGVELLGKLDRDLAVPDPKCVPVILVIGHGGSVARNRLGRQVLPIKLISRAFLA